MQSIQKTLDYDAFKDMPGNRRKNTAQINRLAASFKERPILLDAVPVIVNDKDEICDGQHRKEAAKILGEEVRYIVVPGLTLKDVQILNSGSKAWTPKDYAESYAELNGKRGKNYQIYIDFRRRYHLTHEIAVSFLAIVEGATSYTFRSGGFVVENEELSHKLCKQFNEIQEFHRAGDTKKFAFAVKEIMLHPDYEHERMMAKIKTFGSRFFKEAATTRGYLEQLVDLYNYRSTSEGKIRLIN